MHKFIRSNFGVELSNFNQRWQEKFGILECFIRENVILTFCVYAKIKLLKPSTWKVVWRQIFLVCNISDPRKSQMCAQISQKQDRHSIYVIMKAMFPDGYHHNGFVTTYSLGQTMYGFAQVHHLPKCMSCH